MDDPSFYGFPTYGEAGPKAAQDCGGQATTPAERTFELDPGADARLRAFMGRHLPTALAPEIYTKTCLYTLTPDRDFVVDRVPEAPGVIVLLGRPTPSSSPRCSAGSRPRWGSTAPPHRRRSSSDFGIDRPILLEEAPADVLDGVARSGACIARVSRPVPTYRHSNARFTVGQGSVGPPSEEDSMRLSARARFMRILAMAGLTAALVLPGAASVHAADPVVLRVGTTQDLDSLEPVQHPARRRVRGLRPHLQLPGRLRPEPRAGPRLRRHVGAGRGRQVVDLPHPRQHEVVGRTAGDVGGCLLLVAARPRRDQGDKGESGYLGAGYLDPTLKDAGVTKVDCTDPTKMVVSTDDASDRVLQVAMPIIPKHVWGKETYKTIADAKFDGPARRHRAVHGPGVADRPVHQARPQPQLLGHAGLPGRSRHRHLQGRAGHDGPGAQGR